jgi:aspartyl aminopeptidase
MYSILFFLVQGIPQMGMHSIREMCGTQDVVSSHKLLVAFFNEFRQLDATLAQGN